ncbi:hypothetical protein H6F93_29140 [Leptolyngbya sp. FACHB-671]|uniref:hypothetical protein n=1 Tax=Leptolyngbya sp. FACHB-671 TaxID=2692812 RepID=UPI0016862CD4|nr:hypothetical protein [Leptolyngbya sp. FACHB-671]MBD2071535.1 hypothetical protein [Leptolyngbya sp. FACHB-671]
MKRGDRIMSNLHHKSPTSCHPFRLQQSGLLSFISISVLLGSGWMIAPAWAEPLPRNVLMAQQIVDGLPPPPSVTFGEEIPVAPTQPQQYPQQYNDPAPDSADLEQSGSTDASERFLVYVNGDSPLLLNQVRRVESGAFFQNYDGRQVIQAGVFNQTDSAERRVAELAAQGIGAEVVRVPGVVLANSNTQTVASRGSSLPSPELLPAATFNPEASGQQSNFSDTEVAQANTPIPDDSYYVAIPGDADNISAIYAQVVRLGGNLRLAQVAESRREPFGPHVLVGPFANRSAATRWNRYFRDFGMDARVYYRR